MIFFFSQEERVFTVGQYFVIETSVSVRKAFRRMSANKEVPNKATLFSLAGKKM